MNLVKSKPNDRKILVIVTEDEEYVLPVEPKGRDLLNQPHVRIIADRNFAREGYKLIGEGWDVQSGMVLLLSPFDDNEYIDLHQARRLVAIEKMLKSTRLFQLLGARSVTLERLEIVDREKNKSASWEVEAGGIKGELVTKFEDIEKIKNSSNIDVEFPGAEIKKQEAKEFFRLSHLESDSSLKNIFKMRLDDENQLTMVNLKISLSESINNSIELLASLHLPDIFTKLNLQSLLRSRASVEQIVKESIDITSGINVKF